MSVRHLLPPLLGLLSACATTARAPREPFDARTGWPSGERPGKSELLAKRPRPADPRHFAWPVTPVQVTSPFGEREHPIHGSSQFHAGVDLLADEAQPIYAAEDGTVAFAGWNGGYGQEVELRHDARTFTRYGHLEELLVENGARVKRGDLIGLAGMTGLATGPHLHFELRRDDVPLDPEALLPPWAPPRPPVAVGALR